MNRSPRDRLLLAPLALLAAGCSTLGLSAREDGSGHPLIPTRHVEDVGAFRVASNEPIAADDPALKALAGLEARLDRLLGVRVATADEAAPIEVSILDDEAAFRTFLTFHHPELPDRRAFFLAGPEGATIYTARGDHLEEDLRHEATHALLHRAGLAMPLWLDEGLAEYFEVEPDRFTDEARTRFDRLAASYGEGWRPDLRRLEALDGVSAMTATDYREAWAWSVLMLHGPQRKALVGYLGRIHTDPGSAGSLSGLLGADLLRLDRAFLAQVDGHSRRDPAPKVVRLQSPPAPAEVRVVPTPAYREPTRGPIGRLFDRIFGD